MKTLDINRGIYASSPSHFHFPFCSSQNPLIFSHTTISEKRRSQTHSLLDHREIWAPDLPLNSEHYHHWEFWKYIGVERKTLFIATFSFPEETQNCLSKITIPDSLTVGLSWNFDMWLKIQFRTSSTLGFVI